MNRRDFFTASSSSLLLGSAGCLGNCDGTDGSSYEEVDLDCEGLSFGQSSLPLRLGDPGSDRRAAFAIDTVDSVPEDAVVIDALAEDLDEHEHLGKSSGSPAVVTREPKSVPSIRLQSTISHTMRRWTFGILSGHLERPKTAGTSDTTPISTDLRSFWATRDGEPVVGTVSLASTKPRGQYAIRATDGLNVIWYARYAPSIHHRLRD